MAVVGCAAVASQSAETEGVASVEAKSLPLLLLHGTGDRVLSSSCSERLFEENKRAARDDQGGLKLFEGDDHALMGNLLEAERMLCVFVMKCDREEVAEDEDLEVLGKPLVEEEGRIRSMEEAGDLGEGERLR